MLEISAGCALAGSSGFRARERHFRARGFQARFGLSGVCLSYECLHVRKKNRRGAHVRLRRASQAWIYAIEPMKSRGTDGIRQCAE